MPPKIKRAPVSTRAVIQRISRKLGEFKKLKKCRADSRWYSDLGAYYIVDEDHNTIVRSHVDLETLARELKVIEAWEAIVEDGQLSCEPASGPLRNVTITSGPLTVPPSRRAKGSLRNARPAQRRAE